MFGYISINKAEMKFKDYDVYHSYYCGLCKVLKECYGRRGQVTLSFDEIGNVITVVDAKLEPELSDQADYLLASEAANAGCIVLSRSQEAEDAEIENTVAHLNHAMEKVQCKRRFQNDIIIKDWDTFDNTDYEKLLSCGSAWSIIIWTRRESLSLILIQNRHERNDDLRYFCNSLDST